MQIENMLYLMTFKRNGTSLSEFNSFNYLIYENQTFATRGIVYH